MSQLQLTHDIFHPQVLLSNQRQNISNRLTVLYENGMLDEELYVILATAVATQIIPGPMNSGHRKGLVNWAAEHCQKVNASDFSDEQRIYAKLVMMSVLYLRGDEKSGRSLLASPDLVEGSGQIADIPFIRELKRQGELFNDELHEQLGFQRINAGDIRYSANAAENKELLKSFLGRAKFGNTIFYELVYGTDYNLEASGLSKTTKKRLQDLHKNFKFAHATLEQLLDHPPFNARHGSEISIPYGTPNYG